MEPLEEARPLYLSIYSSCISGICNDNDNANHTKYLDVSIEEYLSNRPLPDCSQKDCGGNKLIANNNQRALCIVTKLMNERDLVYELLACEIFVATPS